VAVATEGSSIITS